MRVNAFVESGNESRQTSIGGRRGQNNSVWSRLITDSDTQSGITLRVNASVHNGKVRYEINLPDTDENVTIDIRGGNPACIKIPNCLKGVE